MHKKNQPPPAVSVIIPAYNRADMLQEAVDSVLAQTFTDFELIVVDDGSTDHTPEILAAYGDRIIHLTTVDRRGVSAARNAGIERSSGGLVAFLDSDDLWLPGKLACQVEFFASRPEALICQTEETWIRNHVRVNPKNHHRKASGMIYDRSLDLCLISPSAVMMKRDLFHRVGTFDEDLPACEDYDLWLRVTCRFPVYLIDTPMIVKRGGHQDQLSREPGLDRYRIRAICKMLGGGLLTEPQRRASVDVLKHKCGIFAAGCIKRDRLEEARWYAGLVDRYASLSLEYFKERKA